MVSVALGIGEPTHGCAATREAAMAGSPRVGGGKYSLTRRSQRIMRLRRGYATQQSQSFIMEHSDMLFDIHNAKNDA